jgi:hypothetical protein
MLKSPCISALTLGGSHFMSGISTHTLMPPFEESMEGLDVVVTEPKQYREVHKALTQTNRKGFHSDTANVSELRRYLEAASPADAASLHQQIQQIRNLQKIHPYDRE